MQSWDDLNAEGAALGVSINFSTGDNGDFYRAVGAYTVSVPSDSPHATAVGGTSDFMNPDYSMKFQTGWGTDLTRIAAPAEPIAPTIPLVCAATLAPGQCFYFGGGGGQSTFFAKPSWQSSLPGTGRQQPDISMTADPYTGVTIIWSYNNPGNYSVGVIGGTSASCPMFSGVWAIVNQKSQQVHGKPAGLAAPYMYTMPGGSIKDVKQSSPFTATNLTGTIMQAGIAPTVRVGSSHLYSRHQHPVHQRVLPGHFDPVVRHFLRYGFDPACDQRMGQRHGRRYTVRSGFRQWSREPGPLSRVATCFTKWAASAAHFFCAFDDQPSAGAGEIGLRASIG